MADWRLSGAADEWEKKPRSIGAFLLLAGVLAFYVGTYQPVSEALAGASSIDYGHKAAIVQPFLFLMGGALAALGARVARVVRPDRRSIRAWLAVAFGLLLGMAYEHGLAAYLNGLGYPVESMLQVWSKVLRLS